MRAVLIRALAGGRRLGETSAMTGHATATGVETGATHSICALGATGPITISGSVQPGVADLKRLA